MTWNYRLVKFTDINEYVHYEICEVFYSKAGRITSWSTRHAVLGQSINGVKWQLKAMRQALAKPLLEEHTVRGKLKLVEAL